MANYELVLFDADDTLLDFQRAERTALRRVLEDYGIEVTQRAMEMYHVINQELWYAYERLEISKDFLQQQRFTLLLEQLGIDRDGRDMNRDYLEHLGNGSELIAGAEELCRRLSRFCTLAIATNGVARTQHRRIEHSAIMPYITSLFISEELGTQKPERAFFDAVTASFPDIPKERILMVGDSLGSDIKGGCAAGIPTCWYNPENKVNKSGECPDFVIQQFEELYGIILEEKEVGEQV